MHSSNRRQFPTVLWDEGQLEVTFELGPCRGDAEDVLGVIMFARCRDGFVLAEIPGRGWVTPSGRLEPGETPLQAASRETWEEAGALLQETREIGRYILKNVTGTQIAPTFLGCVEEYGAIPPGSEARQARCFPLVEIPSIYYRWDPLIAGVFDLANRLSKEWRWPDGAV